MKIIYFMYGFNVLVMAVQYLMFISLKKIDAEKKSTWQQLLNFGYGMHVITAFFIVILIVMNLWLIEQIAE